MRRTRRPTRHMIPKRWFQISLRAYSDFGDHNEHIYSGASLDRNYSKPPRYWTVPRFMQSRMLNAPRAVGRGYLYPSIWPNKWWRLIKGKKSFPHLTPSQYR
jgi:hypothetical protein